MESQGLAGQESSAFSNRNMGFSNGASLLPCIETILQMRSNEIEDEVYTDTRVNALRAATYVKPHRRLHLANANPLQH